MSKHDYKPQVERRVRDRRVILVKSSMRLVGLLLILCSALFMTTMTAVGVTVYLFKQKAENELSVEDVSVPPIDIAIDQPLDVIENIEIAPPSRRQR